MTLTFVTNSLHHHQLPVADEFFRLLGENYHYIATEALPERLKSKGYDASIERSYVIRTYESDAQMGAARRMIDDSDVVIIGDAPISWVLKRKKENRITFHCQERWLKKINLKTFHPQRLLSIYNNYWKFRHGNCYMLCASAYTAPDAHLFGCFPNRCFKWGYITAVKESVETSSRVFPHKECITIMWCSRFLVLKHPELPVQLAARLKKKGYKFVIDMYGSGDQLEKTKTLVTKLSVDDCVHFYGNRPNAEILEEMRQHDIFLFTSDRNEGWGAVLNESMSCGCVPVASNEIGAVPYLIEDRKNGFIFNSCDIDSLEVAVTTLFENPELIAKMSSEAKRTICETWSPKNAAENFVDLANHIFTNRLEDFKRTEGPASWDKKR